jgi:hypothetical protein
MGKYGAERVIQALPLGPPTGVIELGMGLDKDGNKITTAGAEVVAIANDDFDQNDLDLNTANPVTPKKTGGVVLGTCRVLCGGTATKGLVGAVQTTGKFANATAGQAPAVVFIEDGASGDLIEAFKLPQRRAVASADIGVLTAASGTADGTVADVGGAFNQATLNNNFQDLATQVNALRAVLRAQGLML